MEVTENKILLQDINYIYSNLNNKKYFKNKSILITGSNGFIGTYLSNFFVTFFKNLKFQNYIFWIIQIQKLK